MGGRALGSSSWWGAPVEEQDQEPPADLNTGTRPATEGGNLILRASGRGRGNGLANQLPDRASYEVQGKVRYLSILARGGSRVVYTLEQEPRWVLKEASKVPTTLSAGFRFLAPGLPEVHPPGRGPWAQTRTCGPSQSSGWWPPFARHRTVHSSRCAL